MIPSYHYRDIAGDITAALAMAASQSDPQVLVCMAEEVEDIERHMRAQLTRMRELRDTIRANMEARLTPGELVQAPSGRIAYLAEDLADGAATVSHTALDELADELPEPLRPSTRTVYPGVGEVRAALREGRITREQAATLIIEPGRRTGLRWKTLDGAVAA